VWSVVFFLCFIYVVSLVFRVVFGPDPTVEAAHDLKPGDMKWYFESVPISMLTTFRCSFGDCTTLVGTPIFGSKFGPGNGAVLNLAMSCLIFFTTVGLLNVISALFLERIMTNAQKASIRAQRERLHDKTLFKKNSQRFLRILQMLQLDPSKLKDPTEHESELTSKDRFPWPVQHLMHLMGKSEQRHEKKKLSWEEKQELKNQTFSREVVDNAIETDEVQHILNQLDIEPVDCLTLSDTLDEDNNGTIKATELIKGLSRLRGPARRSDIVTVDLQIRSMQAKMDMLWENEQRQQQ